MITGVTFLWHFEGSAKRYSAWHVNTAYRGFRSSLRVPFRMVCVTNCPEGLDPEIKVVALDQALPRTVRYMKLMAFRPDAEELFGGERLLISDLDVTPVDDLTPLVERSEDFVIWQDPLRGRQGSGHGYRYNSSLILMNAGCRTEVYERFDSRTSPEKIRQTGLVGSDQAWIGHVLGEGEAVWTAKDGVLGYKHDLLINEDKERSWPAGARLIVSHGRPKPWELDASHPLRVAYERNAEKVAA